VLQQLHLTDVRTVEAPPSEADLDIPAAAALAATPNAGSAGFAPHASGAPPAPVADVLLRDQIAELRRFLVTSLDQQSERILEDVRAVVRDAVPPTPNPAESAPAPAAAQVASGPGAGRGHQAAVLGSPVGQARAQRDDSPHSFRRYAAGQAAAPAPTPDASQDAAIKGFRRCPWYLCRSARRH
jgi:hypothetical protein